jgi:hypothetical protein
MGRVGVLLLNLGGPEKLEDVRPFLFNLFADPEIIRLPFPWLQKPLAWLISTLRAKKIPSELCRNWWRFPPVTNYRGPSRRPCLPPRCLGTRCQDLYRYALLAPLHRRGDSTN